MRDLTSLEQATLGVRWVAHLAAAKSDEGNSREINVEGAKNLVSACRTNKIEFIINVSTQSTKIQGKGLYGVTKEEAEQVFHSSQIPVTTLRSSLVYSDISKGLFASLIKFARLPVIPVIGPGNAPHWPIHAVDLARAIEIAAQKPESRGQIYDVGGPDQVSLNGLLREFAQRQGLKRPIVHIPLSLGLAMARTLSFLPHPPFTYSNVLGGNIPVTMDVERFFRDFDFTPRPLKQGLDELFRDAVSLDEAKLTTSEAALLLSYVMSGSGTTWRPSTDVQERYKLAVKAQLPQVDHEFDQSVYRHPALLGGLDAVSRLFYPRSILRQKLIVATSLAEYEPDSASWLLPRDRSILSLFFNCLRILLRVGGKEVIGIVIFLFPGFIHRNVRPL
jgi:nucleoside-diphosphate-sugar epimerase